MKTIKIIGATVKKCEADFIERQITLSFTFPLTDDTLALRETDFVVNVELTRAPKLFEVPKAQTSKKAKK